MVNLFSDLPKKINSSLNQLDKKLFSNQEVINIAKNYLQQKNIQVKSEVVFNRLKHNILLFNDPATNKKTALLLHLDVHNTASTQPVTLNAGQLFNDVCFLYNIPPEVAEKKYLLYITDNTMWKYFMNKRNGYHHIFNLTNEQSVTLEPRFFNSKPETFKSALTQYNETTITLTIKLAATLNFDFRLRLLEINSIGSPSSFKKPALIDSKNSDNFNVNELILVKQELIHIINHLGSDISLEDIKIIDRGKPHIPDNLPKNSMGIYMFYYNQRFLKIGKAGPNSNTRFKVNHYSPYRSNSNLALSLLNDEVIENVLNENNVGEWIKSNVQRIDLLFDDKVDILVLNFIESYLHLKYNPLYEGFKKQRK